MSDKEMWERVIEGDVISAARLMRDLDDEMPEAQDALKRLYRHTGKSYILGITGAPGAGKSTLVDVITERFRKAGKTVGIVAIDPTSPFSGGAILGDRIRMQKHAMDEGVFIKSLATRGHLGGLSRSTIDIVNVMDAMGKDVVIIETVGVGQDETEVVKVAHTNLVVVVPGLGDDIQAIKAGILEIADVFVINKSDREGADKTRRELEHMLEMKRYDEGEWKPKIVSTVALSGKGIDELIGVIEEHKKFIEEKGLRRVHDLRKAKVELYEILKSRLFEKALADLSSNGLLEKLINQISEKQVDPYTVVEKVINHRFDYYLTKDQEDQNEGS